MYNKYDVFDKMANFCMRNTAADLDCKWILCVNMQKQSKQIKSKNIITRFKDYS